MFSFHCPSYASFNCCGNLLLPHAAMSCENVRLDLHFSQRRWSPHLSHGTEFLFRIREAVLLLYRYYFRKFRQKIQYIPEFLSHASTGQLFTQRPQWLHSLRIQLYFTVHHLQCFLATGFHTPPQEIQSSSLYSMFIPPLIPTSFSSAFRQLFWHPVTPNLNLWGVPVRNIWHQALLPVCRCRYIRLDRPLNPWQAVTGTYTWSRHRFPHRLLPVLLYLCQFFHFDNGISIPWREVICT